MPIRILHVVTYMGRGGLETMLMNCYRHIDREQVQFDFLVHRDFRADYDDEIEALGGRIFRLPRLNPVSPGYNKALHDFFRAHPEYRIVHSHLDCMSAFPLKAAKEEGVPVRIAHAHSSSQDKDWKFYLKKFFVKKIPGCATHFFACGSQAGSWMFPGQSVTVIKNGVDTQNFSFSPAIRAVVRARLGLADALTLGHVGRFVTVKNHDFLIDVFAAVQQRNPEARLLLVGAGALENAIRQKVSQMGLEASVHFLGVCSDVQDIMQAMDVFVFPSLYEGLPLTLVEAQTAGLPCVISDKVPAECMVTHGLVSVRSLEQTPEAWAEHILKVVEAERRSHAREVADKGYDIDITARWLQEFYLKIGG